MKDNQKSIGVRVYAETVDSFWNGDDTTYNFNTKDDKCFQQLNIMRCHGPNGIECVAVYKDWKSVSIITEGDDEKQKIYD